MFGHVRMKNDNMLLCGSQEAGQTSWQLRVSSLNHNALASAGCNSLADDSRDRAAEARQAHNL